MMSVIRVGFLALSIFGFVTGGSCGVVRTVVRDSFETNCNEKYARLIVDLHNETHDGKVILELYEDLESPKVDLTATINSTLLPTPMELLHVEIDPCDILKSKKENQVVNFLFDRLLADFDQTKWKCPIMKGTFRMNEVRERVLTQDISLPPLVQPGQSVTLKTELFSTVSGKKEKLCTVLSSFKVSN